jgi:hypothetical protein
MKNKYPKMKNMKEYVLLGIGLLWLVLFSEGHRFLPGAKQFSETIPLWAIILNLIILLITFTLIRNKIEFSLVGWVVTIVGCTISSVIWSITCRHFPVISFVGAGAILLISQFLRKEGQRKKNRRKGYRGLTLNQAKLEVCFMAWGQPLAFDQSQ